MKYWKTVVLGLLSLTICLLQVGCSGGVTGGTAAVSGAYSGEPEDQIIAATQAGDAAAVNALLKSDPGLANAWNADSTKSVLHYAATGSSPEVVALLLEKGADPLAKDSEDNTPLDCAQEARSDDAVKQLLVEARKKAIAAPANS